MNCNYVAGVLKPSKNISFNGYCIIYCLQYKVPIGRKYSAEQGNYLQYLMELPDEVVSLSKMSLNNNFPTNRLRLSVLNNSSPIRFDTK